MMCERLSDRMPLVALGQESWTEDERRHLEACPECTAEWRVVSQAAAMGRNLNRDLDVERISGRVVARLAREPVVRRRTAPLWFAGVGIAAALFLLVIQPWQGQGGDGSSPTAPSTAFEIPMMELDSLSHDQLRMVLEAIDEPLGTPMDNELPSMMDLDDPQLERVLRSLEG